MITHKIENDKIILQAFSLKTLELENILTLDIADISSFININITNGNTTMKPIIKSIVEYLTEFLKQGKENA